MSSAETLGLNPLTEFVLDAGFLKGGKPPSKQPNDYRYYHCQLDWDGLACKKVDGPSVLPTQDCTKLLFVKSWIPEHLDTYVLKYKWIPDTVSITK